VENRGKTRPTRVPAKVYYAAASWPQVRLRDIPKGESVFFFLRDPVGRFISGFYSRQRQGKPRYHSPWNNEERIAFSIFNTPNELALAISSEDPVERRHARDAMQSIRHVNSSYLDWFENEGYFRSRLDDIFFIGMQERLTEDFETLKLKLRLPAEAVLPNDDISAHKNPASLDVRLTTEALDNLASWYARDYEFFRQCKALANAINFR